MHSRWDLVTVRAPFHSHFHWSIKPQFAFTALPTASFISSSTSCPCTPLPPSAWHWFFCREVETFSLPLPVLSIWLCLPFFPLSPQFLIGRGKRSWEERQNWFLLLLSLCCPLRTAKDLEPESCNQLETNLQQQAKGQRLDGFTFPAQPHLEHSAIYYDTA